MEKGNNNIGTPVEQKRKRSANWDSLEKNLLRSCITEFVAVIENKNTDTNTNKAKNAAWKKLTERFNELNHIQRTTVEIKQQWRTAKLGAKKKFSVYKNARNETGGGPKPPSPDPETSQIIDMIPKEFEVDFNNLDSDCISEDKTHVYETPVETGDSTAGCSTVVQEIIFSPDHNEKNIEPIFITPTPKSRDQRKVNYSKRKLPLEVNESTKRRNQVLTNCVEEEHKLKMAQMTESHEWAKKEAEMRLKNLELENLLLKAKLNKMSDK